MFDSRGVAAWSAAFIVVLGCSRSHAAEPVVERVVAAKVDGRPIYDVEVRRELASAIGSQKIADAARPRLEAETLEQLIDRLIVQAHLTRESRAASKAEVDRAIDRLVARLAARKAKLAEHLKQIGLTEEELRQDLAWQIGWRQYLDEQISDEALQRHFESHRRDFDGTQIRARQILLRPKNVGDAQKLAALVKQAETIRADVVAGRLKFDEAVTKHSHAASKDDGGDLGFLPRRGQNVEAFSRAVFALKKDEVSPPVVTSFGVHLIQCTDIKPGTKKWTDVVDALRRALASDLFRGAAAAGRKTAKIEYTGAAPHFKPGTKELAGEKKAE